MAMDSRMNEPTSISISYLPNSQNANPGITPTADRLSGLENSAKTEKRTLIVHGRTQKKLIGKIRVMNRLMILIDWQRHFFPRDYFLFLGEKNFTTLMVRPIKKLAKTIWMRN